MACWKIADWLRRWSSRKRSSAGSSRPRAFRTLRIEALEDRLVPANVFWTGVGDGMNWADARNWSSGVLPGAADDVTIQAAPDVSVRFSVFGSTTVNTVQSSNPLVMDLGSLNLTSASAIDSTLTLSGALATFTIDGNLDLQSLIQTNGTFTGAGNVTIHDQWTWTSGSMAGTGHTVLDSTSQATLCGGFFSMLVDRTVESWGTATVVNDGFDFRGDAAWNNRPGSLFTLQDGASLGNFFASPTSRFNNHGLLDVEDGSNTSTIGIPLHNAGDVDLESGTLNLSGGGAARGTFHLAASTVLSIGSDYTINRQASVSGAGTLQVTIFHTLQITGPVHVPNLTVSGGTVTVNSSLVVGNLTENGGTVGGPGTVTINSHWTWTGGNMTGPGRTVLNGTTTLSGGFFSMLDGRTVDNHGTATATTDGIDFRNAAIWNNLRGSTFVLGNAASLGNFFAGAAQFNNAGLLVKNGSGTSVIGFDLNNTGTLRIANTGTLQVAGNLAQTGSGSLQIDIGGTAAGTFGQLRVNGAASLGGNLTVHLVDFTPSPGDAFEILTFGTRGDPVTDFASEDLPAGLSPDFGPNSLTLFAT
jgi:hypothetical protein